jgi:putative transposase
MSGWKKGNTCVYNVSYHIIWTLKYRASILKGIMRKKIIKYLFEKAKTINVVIEKYEIMPDHVHLFIKCTPQHTVSKVIQYLKGYFSYKLRSEYKKYRKYKALWSRSYYCESIGHISENTIKKYIEDQMKK